ncbi:PAS domain-containing protein [Corynascus similis CBS 632.67]
MNNNFYTSPLSPEEAQQRLALQRNGRQGQARPQGQGPGTVNTGSMGGLDHTTPLSTMEGMALTGDSLGDMVSQNDRSFQRRGSVAQPFSGSLSPQDVDHRMSMMGFSNTGDAMQGFSLDFPNSSDLPGASGQFSQQGLMGVPGQSGFDTLSPTTLSMDAFTNLDMGTMGADAASMGLFDSPDLNAQYPSASLDAVNQDFAMDMGIDNTTMGTSGVNQMAGFGIRGSGGMTGTGASFDTPTAPQETSHMMSNQPMGQYQTNISPSEPRETSVPATFQSPASGTSRTMSQSSAGRSSVAATATPASSAPTASGPPLPPGLGARSSKKDVYSKSGFDMLRALFYVATRKNPTVEIGAVDQSCAFVVTDVTLNDCPIIYVSDNFQNLTGYNRHEIVGKNCRFLQSPDGEVEAGSRREFVANDAVFKLKNAVAEGKEIQQSLINYRKGGKPFLNLLTMIPIPWDSDEIKYFIGFQIDLVECPEAISGQDSGAMQVNYRHSDIGQYFWSLPNTTQWELEAGQTLSVDDVSSLIQQYNPKAAPSEWHRQSWHKMLLENADDVIHVLSLKGLFLYLSPSCKKTLEYDPSDLVGTSLSSICHPSDIVPVTRELKDAQQNASVNIAFRIRRKHSGYMWFESHGTVLHEAHAKGRKYIILVGRKRPVFSLRRRDVDAAHSPLGSMPLGADGEIWSKISTSGMFLYVSSSAKSLLDTAPRELEGTSMQDLMRKESRAEFGRTIEKARKGAVVGFKHELLHKRGQLVAAQTVFYPGDGMRVSAKGGPSFLIAQTRLVKGGRVIAAGKGVGGTVVGGGISGGGSGGEDAMAGVVMGNMSMTSAYSTTESDDDEAGDIFAELRTTRCTSWQYELRQMEKVNRLLAEELTQLMANKKKRKRRKGGGSGAGSAGNGGTVVRDCANCHRTDTPEWRRGPSGNRDLCNSCGLRWAKQTGKVSPRNTSRSNSDATVASKRTSVSTASSNSPAGASPLRREVSSDAVSVGSSVMERGNPGEGSGVGNGGSGMEMGPIREE